MLVPYSITTLKLSTFILVSVKDQNYRLNFGIVDKLVLLNFGTVKLVLTETSWQKVQRELFRKTIKLSQKLHYLTAKLHFNYTKYLAYVNQVE